MVIRFLVFIFIILIAFAIYKFISWQLKKAQKETTDILKECKSEEERTIALKNIKRKNVKRGIIIYVLFLIGIPLICFSIMFVLRIISIH